MAKAADYYVSSGDSVRGPTTAKRLRELAASGKLSQDALIARGEASSSWFRAGDLAGLFSGDPGCVDELIEGPFTAALHSTWSAFRNAATRMRTNLRERSKRRAAVRAEKARSEMVISPLPVTRIARPTTPTVILKSPARETTVCPFCRETIQNAARKCRHCGELLDPVLVRAEAARQFVHSEPRNARWHPGVAAVLSFFWPGLGQLYKGQVLGALLWFLMVPIGYIFFIVPGLVLHLICLVDAGSGNPYD